MESIQGILWVSGLYETDDPVSPAEPVEIGDCSEDLCGRYRLCHKNEKTGAPFNSLPIEAGKIL